MSSNGISISGYLRRKAAARAKERGFESVGEYVRFLIREDSDFEDDAELERHLLEGIQSGPAREMTENDWAQLRKRVSRRIAPGKRR